MTRVFDRLERIYAIGDGPGANRPGFSAEEDEACDLAARWMEEAGLEVTRDATGNLVGRLRGEDPSLPEIWSGSHLDSVPQGGKFDGALGVVGALEAVERIGPQRRTLGVVVFRAEETGCQGSKAYDGPLPGAFLELHIEQGRRLLDAGRPLGVVSAIAGYYRRMVTFEGVPGHAGTTPMAGRDDALVKAAAYVLRARDSAHDAVVTVGQLEVEPGAVNVIPGRVTLSLDVRAPSEAELERIGAELDVDPTPRNEPVAMAPELRALLAAQLDDPGDELVSWAGHDAGVMAARGVPSAMLFVRSLADGASHTPEEDSSPEDVALAVDVLERALRSLGS